MRTVVITSTLIVWACLLALASCPLGEDSLRPDCPRTIPALREWTAAPSEFLLSPSSRIALEGASAAGLRTAGEVFSEDLLHLTGLAIPVVVDSAAPGDIALSLGEADPELGGEGYSLDVGGAISIRAPGEAGVFYGTRTVLQLLKGGLRVPGGTGRDWPDYPERGLMVDTARYFYPLPWLKRRVRELAYLKMNQLHLHLSDDQGFRLECASHPEIVSPKRYTKAEVAALVELGRRYRVAIIPEIDLPGHAGWILRSHPELRLVSGDGRVIDGNVDVGNDLTYALVGDLLLEYLPLFPGPYFHLGGDEYLSAGDYAAFPRFLSLARRRYGPKATAHDAYLGFFNWANGIVRANGKTLRTWGDPFEVRARSGAGGLDASIVLEAWSDRHDPRAMAAAGHRIQNSSFSPTYYVAGGYAGSPAELYERWAPHKLFGGRHPDNPDLEIAPLHPLLLGAKLSVWENIGGIETPGAVAANVWRRLCPLAQNCWGSPKLAARYETFAGIAGVIGTAPGRGD